MIFITFQYLSYMNTYNLVLKNGDIITDKEWKFISEEKRVSYMEGYKTVYVCTLPVVKISIKYEDLETEIGVPDGYQVYKANRGQASFTLGKSENKLVAICVGLVSNDKVVEERVLNIYEGIITGWKL